MTISYGVRFSGATSNLYTSVTAEPTLITDFEVGAGKDVLDYADLLRNAATGYDGANPFSTGYLQLVQSGADTLVKFDADGAGNANAPLTIAILKGVTAAGLTSANLNPNYPPSDNSVPTGAPTTVLSTGTEDTAYPIANAALLEGFSDANGDTLSISGLTATHGTIVADAGGFTFTPAANYNGPVSLSYTIDDGHGGTLPAMLNLNVLAVNDAAIVGSADITVQETNTPITTGGVLSISDIDSAATLIAQPNTAGKYGVFTMAADGTWSYKANMAYDYLNVGDSIKDGFQIKSADGTASSVSVTIAGTADTTAVRLGDAPAAQSGTGGQWALAWTQTGYNLLHKSDYTNASEAWTAVKLSGVSSQLLSGGDIYAGDLGVSGQSATTTTVKQEIDGKEALRVTLPAAADSVTIKLANFFENDDGGFLSESGLLRLLDVAGHVVAEKTFFADSLDGAKTVTLAPIGGFSTMELLAGSFDTNGAFVYGGYSTDSGTYGGAMSTDVAGKLHGSDFLLHSVDFALTLVGVP